MPNGSESSLIDEMDEDLLFDTYGNYGNYGKFL